MANYVNITLDTTQPSNPALLINSNDIYTTNQLVNLAIGTGDGITTGYQMKIWGSVDTAYDTNIKTTEGTSTWITYAASKQIKLSTGDGNKTVYMKLRDDVWNESAQISDSITLNTVVPVVTIGGQNVTKISKVTGKNELTFSFTSDVAFTEYKVKVVTIASASHDTGTLIATTNGSSNMVGSGTFASGTPVSCVVKGSDLEVASANDGDKIIKVFVKNEAGLWSV